MSANSNYNLGLNDFQNPLSIHPYDGLNSVEIKDKLTGSRNYRACKQAMEISLSTKRKLVFVHSTLARSTDDAIKAEQWDSCNNLSVAKIWKQLEKRFAVSNGSRKYQLNREVYSIKQDGCKIKASALFSKGVADKCIICDKKGQTKDKCWHHPRCKGPTPPPNFRGQRYQRNINPKNRNTKWRRPQEAQAESIQSQSSTASTVSLTSQQIEQLLKLLP
ncbi:hypothetical protein Cgig2_030953 [Carnegiea gigantea]|uniref:Uncharacterized protein n=1 Tax=Carnegiea gigantea TaxID=171969 RepID=A0A9Q1QCI7_9CARY|nr:hypothetical protein Cgig2_030953 [Carnegiea gigantea]